MAGRTLKDALASEGLTMDDIMGLARIRAEVQRDAHLYATMSYVMTAELPKRYEPGDDR